MERKKWFWTTHRLGIMIKNRTWIKVGMINGIVIRIGVGFYMCIRIMIRILLILGLELEIKIGLRLEI